MRTNSDHPREDWQQSPSSAPLGSWLDGMVRVDSLAEAYACVNAYPSAAGPWVIVSETRSSSDMGATLTMEIADANESRRLVEFDTEHLAAFRGERRFGVDPIEALDTLLEAAMTFAVANPPNHPGSVARFPVPSARYPGRLEVPMAVLATDDRGHAGLFAPPRVVAIALVDAEPLGVGEYPGFDPATWPPPRLGDWPPQTVRAMDTVRLQATLGRFSAVWLRLISAWIDENDEYPQRAQEAVEALALFDVLEVKGMKNVMRQLNPPFWRWLLQD